MTDEEFSPDKTTKFKVRMGKIMIDMVTRRMTDILLVGVLVALVWVGARQDNLASIIAANTAAVQAGTAEARVRAAEMRVKLDQMDASSRYAVCMMRERDTVDIARADVKCAADTGGKR